MQILSWILDNDHASEKYPLSQSPKKNSQTLHSLPTTIFFAGNVLPYFDLRFQLLNVRER